MINITIPFHIEDKIWIPLREHTSGKDIAAPATVKGIEVQIKEVCDDVRGKFEPEAIWVNLEVDLGSYGGLTNTVPCLSLEDCALLTSEKDCEKLIRDKKEAEW